MSKILILQGLPASGKSTYAKELINKEPGKWKRINKDLLREMLDNKIWNDKNEKFILKTRDSLIIDSLVRGYNVIVDDTNFSPKHIDAIYELAALFNAMKSDKIKEDVEVEIKFIDTPLYECIERDSKRENPVGKKVILNMHSKYLAKPPITEYDPGLPSCIICDIDGTLAYMDERSPYDYSKVLSDLPNQNLLRILSRFNDIPLFIFTGRKPSCRVETGTWLYENRIDYTQLVMRKSEDDDRPDEIIKKEFYEEHIKGKYNVIAVFDDRPKVIRMWKELGLFVMDCNRQDSRIDF